MFLDEQLEQIVKENGFKPETSGKLMKAMLDRLPDPQNGSLPFLIELKRIDNAWRLFCKRHKEYNPDGLRKWVLKSDKDGKLKKVLNW